MHWRESHESLEFLGAGGDLSPGHELDSQHEARRRILLGELQVSQCLVAVPRLE